MSLTPRDAFDAEHSSSNSDNEVSYFDVVNAVAQKNSQILLRSSSAPAHECEEDYLFMKESSSRKNISSRSESLPWPLDDKLDDQLEELGGFFGQCYLNSDQDQLKSASPRLADYFDADNDEAVEASRGVRLKKAMSDKRVQRMHNSHNPRMHNGIPFDKRAKAEVTAAAPAPLEFKRSGAIPVQIQKPKKIIGFVVNGQ